MRTLTPLLLFLAGIGAAKADHGDPTALDKERQTLESYATVNAACMEWSDGCAVCARRDDKTFRCSLPGIACEPSGLACRAPKPDTGSKQPETQK